MPLALRFDKLFFGLAVAFIVAVIILGF